MVDFKKLLMKRLLGVLSEHFRLPLQVDSGSFYVLDADGQTVFDCPLDVNNSNYGRIKNMLLKVVEKINGESNEFLLADYNDSFLYVEGEKLLEIRGWGYLTSPACEGMSDQEAMEYQQKVLLTCVKILGNI